MSEFYCPSCNKQFTKPYKYGHQCLICDILISECHTDHTINFNIYISDKVSYNYHNSELSIIRLYAPHDNVCKIQHFEDIILNQNNINYLYNLLMNFYENQHLL